MEGFSWQRMVRLFYWDKLKTDYQKLGLYFLTLHHQLVNVYEVLSVWMSSKMHCGSRSGEIL